MAATGLEEIRSIAGSQGWDAVALVPGANFRRVFGRDFYQTERPLVVIIEVDGPGGAVVPSLEMGNFKKTGFAGHVFPWTDPEGFQSAFRDMAETISPCSIGVEGQRMRVFEYEAISSVFPKAQIIEAHGAISKIRMRKQPSEIEMMREAVQITERAMGRTFEQVKVGMTEVDIEHLLLSSMFKEGAKDYWGPPIVSAGAGSAIGHSKARADYRIQAGDALLIDCGAIVDGYHADITRTVFADHVTDEDAEVYETVRAAARAGRAAARRGATAHDVDDATLSIIESVSYEARLAKRTGHGLGLMIHEDPYIMRGNHQVLEDGMTLTVEPGIYIEGRLGVRIEDDVVVGAERGESLSTYPREITIVGK